MQKVCLAATAAKLVGRGKLMQQRKRKANNDNYAGRIEGIALAAILYARGTTDRALDGFHLQ